jgi:hypothetical protein
VPENCCNPRCGYCDDRTQQAMVGRKRQRSARLAAVGTRAFHGAGLAEAAVATDPPTRIKTEPPPPRR